jgi:hypothetical protein
VEPHFKRLQGSFTVQLEAKLLVLHLLVIVLPLTSLGLVWGYTESQTIGAPIREPPSADYDPANDLASG